MEKNKSFENLISIAGDFARIPLFEGVNSLIKKSELKNLKHYEKITATWYLDNRNSKVFVFTLTHCFNDPSVNGYLLEAEDITQEVAKREIEKLTLLKQLKEKEEEVNSSHQKTAMKSLQLALKKEVFTALENKIERTKVLPIHKQDDLKDLLQKSNASDQHWEQFIHHFDKANFEFFKKLKTEFPNLSQNEDKHCAFIKMKLSTKEVANILGITTDSVKKARQRLKKKMAMRDMQELKNFLDSL